MGSVPAVRFGRNNVNAAIFSDVGPTQREGTFFAYDHLPGGWLILPKTEHETTRIEAVVDGQLVVAKR